MFKICKANLSLTHPDVLHVIQKIKLAEVPTLETRIHKIFKFIWFVNNFDKIENPITTLTWGDQLFEVHPGHFRLFAAYNLGLPYIESIILYNNLDYVNQVSSKIKHKKLNVELCKQAGTGWYMINVSNHKRYQKTKSHIGQSYQTYKNYYIEELLSKYGNLSVIYNNQKWFSTSLDSKKETEIHVDNKLDVFKKITEVLGQ